MGDEILYEAGKLPVWAVVRRSYAYVWTHTRLLASSLVLVFLVNFLAMVVSYGLISLIGLGIWTDIVWLLPVLLAVMSYMVGLHRTVLLEEERLGIGLLRCDRYLWNFVKSWLVIALATLAAATTAITIPFLAFGSGHLTSAPTFTTLPILGATLLLLLPILPLWLKMILALPAAALGYRDALGLSWQLTRGNLLRLLAVFLLTSLPFILVNLLLSTPILLKMSKGAPLVQQVDVVILMSVLFSPTIGFAMLSVLTTAASLCFFFLFNEADQAGEL
jgi:hypothetical protein